MTRILCVEDSEDNLFTLHKRLSLAGFEVKVATNGTEGVEWAKTLRPHLIVMDLRLPGLDGWQATRRLKGQPSSPGSLRSITMEAGRSGLAHSAPSVPFLATFV